MGNTVGSQHDLLSLVQDNESAYGFGLWCADGYFWSSSIGLTNVDKVLIDRFSVFLERFLPKDRQKLRVYEPRTFEGQKYSMRLAKQSAYQLYVNCRPLLRQFQGAEKAICHIPDNLILSYLAGRFDGDGCLNPNLKSDVRISYSNMAEAEVDHQLVSRLYEYQTTVYGYQTSGTYVLYFRRGTARQFLQNILPFSSKVKSYWPRRDLV